MNKCKKYKDSFPEALFGELSTEDNQIFQTHLSKCSECNKEFAKYQGTLKIMDEREQPELTPDYWERYWGKLETEIVVSESASPSFLKWWSHKLNSFRFEIKYAYQFAGAVALLMVGIFIGSYFTNNQENIVVNNMDIFPSDMNVELTNRTSNYLQKSKILLLGLVNFDPELDDPYAIDLPQHKQISRELITESNYLKDRMETSQQNQMFNLISDLEVILLQIANLETEHNLPAIEIVKSGVERKGILLQINIEEMRKYQSDKPDNSKKEKKSRTI
jgi:hypothetical protein